MTPQQRDGLLERQQRARLPLGQVIATLGLAPADVLEDELCAYHETLAEKAAPG